MGLGLIDRFHSAQAELLAKKDRELQYLRGLADRQASLIRLFEKSQRRRTVGPGPLPAQTWRAGQYESFTAGLDSRRGRYFASSRPPDSPSPLRPNPGNGSHHLSGQDVATVGIGAFGLKAGELAAVVDAVSVSQRRGTSFIPVFLTDATDSSEFRREGFVFEYFPNSDVRRRFLGERDSDTYFRDKLRFVMMKWGISGVLHFGRDAFPDFTLSPK